MAVWKDTSKTLNKVLFGNNIGLATRRLITATQLSAKNSKNSKTKDKKEGRIKKEEGKPKQPLIPQSQQEYEKFISTYKNGDFFKYDGYSYYDIENDLLQHRQPQPKKPVLY